MQRRDTPISVRWIVLAMLVSCGSPEKEAYDRLARELNPLIVEMAPVAARLLATPNSDTNATINTCWAADTALRQLREVSFDSDYVYPEPPGVSLSFMAKQLLDGRKLACPLLDTPRQLAACAEFCRGYWIEMMDEVDRLRKNGRKYGIQIASLRP